MNQIMTILLLATMALNAGAQERITHVTTATLGDQVIYPEFSVPATTLSINDSRISAETSGRILELPVLVGDQVEKGQPLASLDCRNNRARLQQARATLEAVRSRNTLAKRQIERTLSLRQTQNVSQELLDQRESNLNTTRADRQAQQARLEETELEVERCQIQAPFAGIVMQRLKAEGEWVTPGQPVIHLLDSERLEVSAQVPVDRVASINHASGFMLTTNQGEYPLRLRRVLPVVESRGRNREVRFRFDTDSALPGSTGRLSWRSSSPHIPADIPVRRGDRLGIFLARDGKARFHPLPDALEGQPAAINLPPASRIVIEGRHGLSHDAPIQTGGDPACCPSAGKE
jgi:RND family efflux transporter MFP subunit